MSETPWTPGPWSDLGPSGFRGTLIVGDSRDAPPDVESDDRLVHTAVAEVLDDANANGANARLIAAAPEMVEMLEKARRPHQHLEQDCWYCCSAPHPGDYSDTEPHTTCDDSRSGKPCDCGADAFNAPIDALLARIRGDA